MKLIAQAEAFLTANHRRLGLHARRHRVVYGAIAFALFCFGFVVSAVTIDLEWRILEVGWLSVNLLIGAPVAIGLNAMSLRVSAGIVDASLTFPVAFRTCCIALCSNLLPIPAGTVIQASSLASRGGSVLHSGFVVLLGNAIGLALAVLIVGAILFAAHPSAGIPLLATGMLGVTTGAILIYMRTTSGTTLAFIAVRLLRVIVIVLRIYLSFLAIGLAVAALDAALFAGAVVMGSVFVVFPSGLGISESIAALLALATTVSPGSAFLATALNRLITLAFASTYLLITKPSTLKNPVR